MKSFLPVILVSIFSLPVFGQNGVRIARTTGTADASAMLDIVADGTPTWKGFLMPRMTTANRNSITVTSAQKGLMVFLTDANSVSYYDGTAWQIFGTGLSGSGTGAGAAGYVSRWNAGTSLTNSIIYDSGTNIGVGVNPPLGRLDVQGTTTRSGTHAAAPSFYVTGSLNPGQTGPASGNVEFRHDNGTQGIGFGYNTIYQTGSNTNQDLNLLSRGNSPLTLNAYGYSTGFVGVGTSSPASTLDVGGTSNSAFIQNMAAWGLNARMQGVMIIPEGSVTDNGSGSITFGNTVIVMSPLSGTWIRVAAGTYTLGGWDALYIDMPPTGTVRGTVTPSVRTWADSDRNYDGRDRIVLAQRSGSGPVYFNFDVPYQALNTTGSVVQMKAIQTRTTATYTATVSGNGTQVTPLDIVITPRKAGNAMVLQWVVNGEMNHDDVYIVLRDGVQLANTTNGSNNRWAGVASHPYENGDDNSTISNVVVSITDFNTLATATTYSLWVRSSNGTAHTLYLNRCVGSTGQDSYENTLSTGTATEIQQ